VIVIGWDGADWQLLDALMARGRMPELSALVHEGAAGVLRTIQPPLSPIVWTTMMTGRSPLDHRVLDFTRFNPATRVREPITSAERRVPAVWTIAAQAHRSTGVFGMWATFPAEPVSGVIVSDRLMSFQNGAQSPTKGVVYPDARSAWAGEALSRAGAAATTEAIEALAPGVVRDPRLAEGLRRILVETAVYDELASAWYDEQHPDLTILYVQGTDAIGHLFAPYRPPPMRGIDAGDVLRWGEVADRYYAEADRRLGAWRRRAQESGATLLLVSDHGFLWGEGRPARAASAAAPTAGQWHRDEGIYVVAGPGLMSSSARGRGEVTQVAPSILALLGIPPDRAMPEPLAGLAPAPGARPDYAAASGKPDAGIPSPEAPVADEAIARLRALGYVGGAEPDRAPDRSDAGTRTAGSFGNEGLILREADVAVAIGREQRHAVARLHTELLQRCGEAPGALMQLRVADAPITIDQRHARAVQSASMLERIGEGEHGASPLRGGDESETGDVDHDVAKHIGCLRAHERVTNARERKDRVDHGPQLGRVHEAQHAQGLGARG